MTTTNSRIIAALVAVAILTGCADRADTSMAAPDLAPTSSDASEPSVAPNDSSDHQPPATSQLAAVALRFDGQQVPIATTCNGVDGAVLVTTPGEVTVSLVPEGDTAIRYSGEGMSAETADVTIEQVGASTLDRATVSSDAVPAVDVALEINDTSTFAACTG